MARGWESKNVEEQQSMASSESPSPNADRAAERERQRRLQELQLQRERILSERTSNPHRRSALEAALLEIEERLAELGWSVHI